MFSENVPCRTRVFVLLRVTQNTAKAVCVPDSRSNLNHGSAVDGIRRQTEWNQCRALYGIKPQRKCTFGDAIRLRQFHTRQGVMPYQACGLNKNNLNRPFRFNLGYFWCGRRELNPYGKTTRPSNVRVCQFRHSRNGFSIIHDVFAFVKPFFQILKRFLKSFFDFGKGVHFQIFLLYFCSISLLFLLTLLYLCGIIKTIKILGKRGLL